mmetsp:Transcript_19311/g.56133  ORF Transcript_19311/g.56133 Transcript_19311/m.56133 type:complete len:581 (-) Transcript_19311:112-1854(-)
MEGQWRGGALVAARAAAILAILPCPGIALAVAPGAVYPPPVPAAVLLEGSGSPNDLPADVPPSVAVDAPQGYLVAQIETSMKASPSSSSPPPELLKHPDGSIAAYGDKGPESVEQTVNERIERDGRRLGSATERLVAIQEGIRKVEHELLDKVFDMASLKAFYERHRHELDEQRALERQRAALFGKVGALSTQLTQAQDKYAQQEREHLAETKQMREDIAGKTKQVATSTANIKAAKHMMQENFELEKSNNLLRQQNAESLENLEKVMQSLNKSRSSMDRRLNQSRAMEEAFGGQHQYEEDCELKVRELQAELAKVQAIATAAKNRVLTVKTKGWKALQAILQYNAALKKRLLKAKANMGTIQAQVLVTTEQQTALQMHGEKQLTKLRAELGELREQLAYLENTLTGTVLQRQATLKEIRVITEQIHEIEARLLSGELAALRANNTRLKSALVEAQVVNQGCEAVMAQAQANVTRMNVTLVEMRRTTNRHNTYAQNIARRFLQQIVAAKDRGVAAMEEAEEAAMLAESVQPSDCDGVWDRKHPAVMAELDKCKTFPDDLAAANAQIASLSSLASASGGGR